MANEHPTAEDPAVGMASIAAGEIVQPRGRHKAMFVGEFGYEIVAEARFPSDEVFIDLDVSIDVLVPPLCRFNQYIERNEHRLSNIPSIRTGRYDSATNVFTNKKVCCWPPFCQQFDRQMHHPDAVRCNMEAYAATPVVEQVLVDLLAWHPTDVEDCTRGTDNLSVGVPDIDLNRDGIFSRGSEIRLLLGNSIIDSFMALVYESCYRRDPLKSGIAKFDEFFEITPDVAVLKRQIRMLYSFVHDCCDKVAVVDRRRVQAFLRRRNTYKFFQRFVQ